MSQPTDNHLPPHPDNHPPPKILRNHGPIGDQMVVEYSLPGLRRAHVRVPYQSWRNGEHRHVGKALADSLAEIDLQTAKRLGKLPS